MPEISWKNPSSFFSAKQIIIMKIGHTVVQDVQNDVLGT